MAVDPSAQPSPARTPASTLLAGKNVFVTGVVTTDSIAWATALAAQSHGAQVIVSAAPRDHERALEVVGESGLTLLTLDVNDPDQWDALTTSLRQVGPIHAALHAVAWAPQSGLTGRFSGPPPDRLDLSFATSVSSYAWLAGVLAELAPASGASLVGLDFDSSRAWGTYNWMGVMKAALQSANRYAARDLGPRNIRANLVAAGPLRTRAASGIPGFQTLLDSWELAPLGWDASDAAPVADVVCFLWSDLARAITGQVLHVDGGHSAVQGAPE